MKCIALAGQKGGSGKSLIAMSLACVIPGRVAIVDLDPQASCVAWATQREQEMPRVVASTERSLLEVLGNLRDYDFTILDTPGYASARGTAILRAADIAVCPLQPTALDVATGEQTADLVKASGTPGMFVLNRCPDRAREVAEARAFLGPFLPVCAIEIPDRRIYGRAIADGTSAQEIDAEGVPAQKIRELWSAIEEQFTNAHR